MEVKEESLVTAVGVSAIVSLAVLGVVGRKSYQRKIVQLTKELEKEGKKFDVHAPPKVWAVLTPQETVKVFAVPLAFVLTGTAAAGYGMKRWWGIRDWQHGVDTLKWIAKVGPPPSKSTDRTSS